MKIEIEKICCLALGLLLIIFSNRLGAAVTMWQKRHREQAEKSFKIVPRFSLEHIVLPEKLNSAIYFVVGILLATLSICCLFGILKK